MATDNRPTFNLWKVSLTALAVLLFVFPLAFSGGSTPGSGTAGTAQLQTALNDLCCQLQSLVPVTAMLLVIAAGVIYSIGQMFGSETRARANVWATSCLTGAVIGILIAQIAPWVLGIIAGVPGGIVCAC